MPLPAAPIGAPKPPGMGMPGPGGPPPGGPGAPGAGGPMASPMAQPMEMPGKEKAARIQIQTVMRAMQRELPNFPLESKEFKSLSTALKSLNDTFGKTEGEDSKAFPAEIMNLLSAVGPGGPKPPGMPPGAAPGGPPPGAPPGAPPVPPQA